MKPRKWNWSVVGALFAVGVSYMVSQCKCANNPPSQPLNSQDYCRSVGRVLGLCVPLQDCSLFSRWLKERPIVKQNVKNVVKFTCYFDLQQPKVCCPLPEIRGKGEEPTSYNLIHDAPGSSRSSGVKTPPRHHPPQDEGLIFPDAAQQRLETHSTKVGRKLLSGSSLLPSLEECGSSVKLSRHLGTFGAHPWIAILGHKDLDNGKWTHICSGTLINPKYILTSAHCLSKFPEYQITHVRLGEYDLQTEIDRGSPFLRNTIFEEHAVQRSIIHPDYQRPGRGADIALIRLKDRVSYSEFVQPICLPLRDHYAMSSYWGTSGSEPSLLVQGKLLVAGWGRLHANSTGYRTLQEAQVKITPEDECQDSNRNLFSPAKQYCVGGNYRQNICVTDDGGALILPMRLGSRATAGPTPKVFQMGIFSSGPSVTQCQTWEGMDHRLIFLRHNNRVRSALPQSVPKPTIYSKVIPHLDWMQRQLQP